MVVCNGQEVMHDGRRAKVSGTFKTNEGRYATLRDPDTGKSLGNYPVDSLKPIDHSTERRGTVEPETLFTVGELGGDR